MKRFTTFSCRATDAVLVVTSYQEGQLEGWLAHSRAEEPQQIKSIPQLLFYIDKHLLQAEGAISYQAFEPAKYAQFQGISTLRIQVLFQEHHTWQGCILWEEQKLEIPFRSVWELIRILDEILAE